MSADYTEKTVASRTGYEGKLLTLNEVDDLWAKLTAGGASQTRPFNVLIDPRVEAGGVSVVDLVDQYEHNRRMDAMVKEVDALADRVSKAMSSADAGMKRRLQPVADKLLTPPIRYSKPGLQDHIRYLQRMTTGADQKVGQDAKDRYVELRKELTDVEAEANKVLGTIS